MTKLRALYFFILPVVFLLWSFSYSNRDPFLNSAQGAATLNQLGSQSGYVYSCQNRGSAGLATLLQRIYPDIAIAAEEESNHLVFKTYPEQSAQILAQLKQLDQPLTQIEIEITVVEINENYLSDLGIQWQLSHSGISITQTTETAEIIKKVGLLLGKGSAQLLAKPKISTLYGNIAQIHIGDKIPYALPVESATGKTSWDINYIEAGVSLRFEPHKTNHGFIAMDVAPAVSSIKQWKQTAAGEFPIISSREVSTRLRIKDGESFIIGGLLNEEERESWQKVPILGDVPLLSLLFKNRVTEKVKSDVLFIVTAKRI